MKANSYFMSGKISAEVRSSDSYFYQPESLANNPAQSSVKAAPQTKGSEVPPVVEVKTVAGEDPVKLHQRFLLEAASEAGLDGTRQQKAFVEKYGQSGIEYLNKADDPSPKDGAALKSSEIKGGWGRYSLSPELRADLQRLQREYVEVDKGVLKPGKTYENTILGEPFSLARRGATPKNPLVSQEAYERQRLQQLFRDAQLPETSIFGTPSKLRDLKHITLDAPADGKPVDAERALRLYVQNRYGDRLNSDSRDVLCDIAKGRGIKVENLAPQNGTVEFDLSVENLLKLHHAYIGVQEKVNAELEIAKNTIDNLAHNRFAKGVLEGAWDALKANWKMVSDPVGTIKEIVEAAGTLAKTGVQLAQMNPIERSALFAQLAKAGVKGLAEMPVNEAAERLGKIVGAAVVEFALGKGLGAVLTVLKNSKFGIALIADAVKIGKELKTTVGKTPIVPPGFQVAVTNEGLPVVLQTGEWTRLEDLLKPLESRAKQVFSSDRRNIDDHELLGGHTKAKHIGKSESWLKNRLESDPDIGDFASSFRNEAVANRVQGRFVNRFKAEIDEWLKSDRNRPLSIKFDMNEPVGIVVERGKNGHIVTSNVRVVLVKDNSLQGWHFLTSFPEK